MIRTLDFCELKFYDNYVICVVNDGSTVNLENSRKQTEAILNHFDGKPFVYITYRIKSYAVDPKIYFNSSKVESLMGFAVVSINPKAKMNAQIEQMFFTKPFKIFSKLDDAVLWAESLIKKS